MHPFGRARDRVTAAVEAPEGARAEVHARAPGFIEAISVRDVGGVLDALETFTGGGPPADDYTLLAMTFVRSRKKAGEISGEWRAVGR